MTLPPVQYVEDDHHLRQLVPLLRQEPLLAVDTESNSLHAYRERVCLIQMSTRSADYILDPLTIGDLSPLAPLFADESIEKVFHAAEYDLMCMKRDFGFRFRNLFDTMVAARICGIKQIGLGSLLKAHADITVDKSHQRDDWGKRPLPETSLHYAQMDTHYLPALRDHLEVELEQRERIVEARESFEELCEVRPANNSFDPEGYWRIAFPSNLSSREVAVLRELYLWREQMAEQRDVPPFKIMGDKTMIALAVDQPTTFDDIRRTHGLGHSNAHRYGRDLLRLIERGRSAIPPKPPPPEPPVDARILEVYAALREWRKARAAERGVESDVIVSREAIWTLANQMPTTLEGMQGVPGLGQWRLAAYGEELLDVIKKFTRKKK